MKSTSPSSRLVNKPARSPAFSMVGPLVLLRLAPIALARMLARVVLPRPGGPFKRTWSMGSPRFLAAATVISSRSLTLAWPVNSENRDGRKVISKARSGLVRTSVILRSAIRRQNGEERGESQIENQNGSRRGKEAERDPQKSASLPRQLRSCLRSKSLLCIHWACRRLSIQPTKQVMRAIRRSRLAFTLIELLVVIA